MVNMSINLQTDCITGVSAADLFIWEFCSTSIFFLYLVHAVAHLTEATQKLKAASWKYSFKTLQKHINLKNTSFRN